MAPQKQPQPPFQKDERVLCFHMEMLYEAKILDIMAAENGEGWQYKIHYKGWKSSWDDWVPQDRVRKFTDENKDLAAQLLAQFKMLQSGKAAKQAAKKGGAGTAAGRAANGSDMSSARGSEERTAGGATTTSGRGPRRARDYELEQVSSIVLDVLLSCFFSLCVAFWRALHALSRF
jgi:mortality factor 4-like protein 1